MTRISVCMAVYNGEKYIRQQLDSILMQLGADDEVIVSDDDSTDRTLAVVEEIGDRRIKVYHHHKMPQTFHLDYTTRNYENALMQTTGDYVFLSDQDDVWLPGRVDRMVMELQHAMLCLSDCYVGDENLNVEHKSYFDEVGMRVGVWKNIVRQTMLGCCMAFRRELLDVALPFPPTKVGHDLWLAMMATHYYNVSCIRLPLSIYRRHSHAVTTSGKASSFSLHFKIYYRLFIVQAYIKKVFQYKFTTNRKR